MFHEDWIINLTSSQLLTKRIAPLIATIFELGQDIIGTNLLTTYPPTFHEDKTIHVASRVKTALPTGGYYPCVLPVLTCQLSSSMWPGDRHVLGSATTLLECRWLTKKLTCSVQPQDIMRTNVLTKVHEEINSPTPGSHVLKQSGTIFELIQDII
ncbi:hypothetical protein DPMN_049273 [Dreissena polymorpha]|uniref:Uncharacterized protein n=1 Tax=Dreissena polymorpha TaxID=45954 RepID=A0A9D4CFL3_DREPO|nr:hypothetical protein DPMN_049273 [Dreissena polymorpha]